MAKIDITVNTEDKVCSVAIDGESIENVAYASISKGCSEDEGYYVSVSTIEKMENGVRKSVHYSSSASEEGKTAIRDGIARIYGKNKDVVRFEKTNHLGDEFLAALFPNR